MSGTVEVPQTEEQPTEQQPTEEQPPAKRQRTDFPNYVNSQTSSAASHTISSPAISPSDYNSVLPKVREAAGLRQHGSLLMPLDFFPAMEQLQAEIRTTAQYKNRIFHLGQELAKQKRWNEENQRYRDELQDKLEQRTQERDNSIQKYHDLVGPLVLQRKAEYPAQILPREVEPKWLKIWLDLAACMRWV
jgi:hypothetical protein